MCVCFKGGQRKYILLLMNNDDDGGDDEDATAAEDGDGDGFSNLVVDVCESATRNTKSAKFFLR